MKLKKGLVLRHIGKEHIIIMPDKGVVDMTQVFTLNDTAAWLWEQLNDSEFSAAQVEQLLTAHYQVDKERARHDALAFVQHLTEQQLIEE